MLTSNRAVVCECQGFVKPPSEAIFLWNYSGCEGNMVHIYHYCKEITLRGKYGTTITFCIFQLCTVCNVQYLLDKIQFNHRDSI